MTRAVRIKLLGAGNVGRALLGQIRDHRARHADRLGIRLDVTTMTDRDGLVDAPEGLANEDLSALIRAKANGARLQEEPGGAPWDGDPEAILDPARDRPTILVDTTATSGVAPALHAARDQGWGLVLANKLPLAGPLEAFDALTQSPHTRYETTVAAALPVVSTLERYLLDTGDRIRRVRGCVSGTLNQVCQRMEAGESLSAIVHDARAHGHTEPDPREDLAGRDAARKALILARLIGKRMELEDVEVEPLYPSEMDELAPEAFMERLGELDVPYAELAREAREAGRSLRYVVEASPEAPCRARLEQLEPDDDLLRPGVADSVVAITSERYDDEPLVVRGKGSGPELTASGVLADVVSLAWGGLTGSA